jgi:membrane-associated protease RseP (regulator of RpoE activity)
MSDPVVPTELLDPSPAPHEVHIVYPLRRRYWLHLLLFVATIFTTLVVGARLQYNFALGLPQFHADADLFPLGWAVKEPSRLLLGIPFSVTLLAILLAHEMGHFVYAQRNHVYATLPFFLPAPTLIGTLGAFIRIRSPIRSRAALFDIGIAGPIAGFVLALPILVFSLYSSRPANAPSGDSGLVLGFPLIFHAVWRLLSSHAHLRLDQLSLAPAAIAAWVGMFATALNLLPGGQLDGGHIVYALSPRSHRTVSRLTMLVLIPMGIFWWMGWLIWAAFLLLSLMRHPPVPEFPPLDRKRNLLGWFALLMFVLTLSPQPFAGAGLMDVIRQIRS